MLTLVLVVSVALVLWNAWARAKRKHEDLMESIRAEQAERERERVAHLTPAQRKFEAELNEEFRKALTPASQQATSTRSDR